MDHDATPVVSGADNRDMMTPKERMIKQRAEAEGRRLARLNKAANENRERDTGSPPIPTMRPGGSLYKQRLANVQGDPLPSRVNKELGYGRPLRKGIKTHETPEFVLSLNVGRDPSKVSRKAKFNLMAKTITSMSLRPHLVLIRKAEMIQRAWENYRVKTRTNFFLKPLLYMRREEHKAAMTIQRMWKQRNAKHTLVDVVKGEIRRILHNSLFSFVCFAYVWIARVKIRMAKHELVVARVLDQVLENRKSLIARRGVQRVKGNVGYRVRAPAHNTVNNGITKRLTRRAQVQSEQRLRLGMLHPFINGFRNAQKGASKLVTRMLQIESDGYDTEYGDDYDDRHRESVEAHKDGRDFTHGLELRFHPTAVDINDVRVAHMRSKAVSNFVKLKRAERGARMSAMGVYNSDDED